MTILKQRRIPTFALMLLLAATLSFAPVASACAATESFNETPTADNHVLYLIGQLDCMLSSTNSVTRQQAMQDIINLAQRPHLTPDFVQWAPENVLPKATDFRSLVPALLATSANDRDPQMRTMAAVALHAVGDESGMIELWKLADKETSALVQSRMSSLLGDYFVRAYPELQGERRITRAKVKRAQRNAPSQVLLGEVQ